MFFVFNYLPSYIPSANYKTIIELSRPGCVLSVKANLRLISDNANRGSQLIL